MFCETLPDKRPRCGEIWMCHLVSKDGSVQNGYRPVFVLSNNKNNTYSTTLNVIPITSKINKKHLPVHVDIWNFQKYGLKTPSTMLVEQIMTVSVDQLDRCIGMIEDNGILNSITRAMFIQFPVLATA